MHATDYHATAHAALHNATAEFAGLTYRQQAVLVRDILDLMAHESLGLQSAIVTLLRRVAPASLESYARTLIAGEDREARIASRRANPTL